MFKKKKILNHCNHKSFLNSDNYAQYVDRCIFESFGTENLHRVRMKHLQKGSAPGQHVCAFLLASSKQSKPSLSKKINTCYISVTYLQVWYDRNHHWEKFTRGVIWVLSLSLVFLITFRGEITDLYLSLPPGGDQDVLVISVYNQLPEAHEKKINLSNKNSCLHLLLFFKIFQKHILIMIYPDLKTDQTLLFTCVTNC